MDKQQAVKVLFLSGLFFSGAQASGPHLQAQTQAQAQSSTNQNNPSGGFEDSCRHQVNGIDIPALQRFDKEFRLALRAGQIEQLAVLVAYPLRVNQLGRGSLLLSTPEALQGYYETFFSPDFRALILSQPRQQVACMGEQVMYANGHVWVKAVKHETGRLSYRIGTLNLLDPPGFPGKLPLRRLDFVCETADQRVVIDSVYADLQERYRYRVWNKPRLLSEQPDLELPGVLDDQGRGVCGYSRWHFVNGNTTYTLSEHSPCGSGDEPADSLGELRIFVNQQLQQTLLCR